MFLKNWNFFAICLTFRISTDGFLEFLVEKLCECGLVNSLLIDLGLDLTPLAPV